MEQDLKMPNTHRREAVNVAGFRRIRFAASDFRLE